MNSLLTESVINQFDYNEIKNNIITFISAINLLTFRLSSLERPKITANYEIRYSCYVPTVSSKLENFVLAKICLEEEIKVFISKYVDAINSLNEIERKIFIKTYINDIKDDIICYEEKITLTKLLHIKKSASIKFSTILNLDIISS